MVSFVLYWGHLNTAGQDSLKLFINDDTTPFAAVKHSRFVVKIPVEVPDDCTVRFEGKLWYRQTHLPDAPKKQIAFKASHVAASLADKEVGLIPGNTIGEFEVFTFERQTTALPKQFQQKQGFRRVGVYAFHGGTTVSYKDDKGEHQQPLPKHSITQLWLPATFVCEVHGKMKTQFPDMEFHQKQFMAFDLGQPDDVVAVEVDLARAAPPAPQAAPEGDPAPEMSSPSGPRIEEESRNETCDGCSIL